MAVRLRGHEVIVSFLAMIVLSIVLSVLWIAWWLAADLFSGSRAQPARIIPAIDESRRTARPSHKRPPVSD